MKTRLGFGRTAVLALTVVLISSVGAAAVSAAPASAAPLGDKPAQSADRVSMPTAKGTRSVGHLGDSRSVVDVKFAEGTDVRVRGGNLVSQANGRIAELDSALARFPGTHVTRLFDGASEVQHTRSQQDAVAQTGRPQIDLNLYFRLQTRPGTDIAALVDALGALDIVESVAPESLPVAPVTPSFVSQQGYRTSAANGGIDADYAQTVDGGKGEYAGIVDVEYSWNRAHEDLSKARVAGSALANGTPCDPFAATQGVHSRDHGTAVLGELVGDANSFGVTGLAPSATLHTVNAASLDTTGCNLSLANAINVAANNASAGDVILIEQQASGPNRTDPKSDVGYVPVEWDQTTAVWAAIHDATSRGRIVVEPAGNGSQNLDSAAYNDINGRNWFSYDSGAILVGAGNAPGCAWGTAPTIARGRLPFSNYGSRLNVQGWGDCVTTTGYGSLQGGTDSNLWYTNEFAGTSSASPIVAAAAALLSSVAEGRGSTLTPASVRSMLASTGQAQNYGLDGKIGPLPNVKAAINALGPKLVDAGHVLAGTNLGATTVPVQQRWTNSTGGAVQYDVWLKTDDGSYVQQTLSTPTASTAVFKLERTHDYQFVARAKDAAGVWGAWAFGTKFNVGEYQENYTATNPAYAGTWTRAAWTSASDGYLNVSATAGDTAKFTFTGTSVAWIATKSSNRGQADVYFDGVRVKTVDLYSATTTSAQAVAYARSWATSGQHTLEVRVLGTAGHPKVDVDAFVRLR